MEDEVQDLDFEFRSILEGELIPLLNETGIDDTENLLASIKILTNLASLSLKYNEEANNEQN